MSGGGESNVGEAGVESPGEERTLAGAGVACAAMERLDGVVTGGGESNVGEAGVESPGEEGMPAGAGVACAAMER